MIFPAPRKSTISSNLRAIYALPIPGGDGENAFSRKSAPEGILCRLRAAIRRGLNLPPAGWAAPPPPHDAPKNLQQGRLARTCPSDQAKDSPSFTCNDTSCSAQNVSFLFLRSEAMGEPETLRAMASHRPREAAMYASRRSLHQEGPYSSSDSPNVPDASIREGATELLSARVLGRANPGGAGDGHGERKWRTSHGHCRDTGMPQNVIAAEIRAGPCLLGL